MPKSVLISIRPKWCELIASGKKTIEVRKTKPKIECPFKCYIYECNWKENTKWSFKHKGRLGKVIGEFVCDEIIEYVCIWGFEKDKDCYYNTCSFDEDYTCLTDREMGEYGKGVPLFGWHISDLVIYDKPMELSELKKPCMSGKCPYQEECGGVEGGCIFAHRIRPPRSWCYVEGGK